MGTDATPSALDGRAIEVDVREAGPHTLSVIADGRAHEVGIEPREGGYRVALRGQVLEVSLVEAARGAAAPRARRRRPRPRAGAHAGQARARPGRARARTWERARAWS